MALIIDVRAIMDGRVSGVTVYIKEFLKELLSRDLPFKVILFCNSFHHVFDNVYGAFDFLLPYKDKFTLVSTRYPNILLNFILSFSNLIFLDELIQKKLPFPLNENVFFLPDLRPFRVSSSSKIVTTFHDLSFEHAKESFSLKTRLWHFILRPKRLAQRSDKIIAISNFTKAELVTTYGISEEKISVVYHGVSSAYFDSSIHDSFELIRKRYGLPENYFLSLSTLEPRKNLDTLLKAFAEFHSNHRNHQKISLVIAGDIQPDVFSKVELPKADGVYCIGFIEEAHKPALYQHALGFIYVSRYEGFGLPVLEAMASACPVMVANNSAPAEIAHPESIKVAPDSLSDIYEGFEKLLTLSKDKIVRSKMREHAQNFSWKLCVDKSLKLFESLGIES